MNTEYLVINNSRKGQKIKYFGAITPHINWAILSEAFVIKAVNLGNLSWFVVASDKGDSISISYFKRQQQKECLHRMKPSVNEIAHENIISLRTISSYFEQFH